LEKTDEDVKKSEPSYNAGGNVKCAATVENWWYLKNLNRISHYIIQQFHYYQYTKKIQTQVVKKLNMNVHSCTIHNNHSPNGHQQING
jgi:hypothetical protein